MTLSLRTLLMLAALVVFAAAALGVDVGTKVSLLPLGLAILAAGFVVSDTGLSRR